MAGELSLRSIREAASALDGVIVRTPIEDSAALSAMAGAPVLLKCENLQRGGSFKIRGAYLRMSRLSAQQQARGVVAASAGNHAQGVALAARALGVDAVVYMPEGAALPKIAATKGYGATVRTHGRTVDEALVEARAEAERTGRTLVHPFDHLDVITGQATLGLEIAEQVPDVQTVVVPTGGGGLLAGIAAAVKAERPDVTVVGVQAEGAAAYPPSLAAGHPEPLASMATMADGIAVGRPGDVPFATIAALVDEVVTVNEEAISQALLMLIERAKLVVEPAGGTAVAAFMDQPTRFETPAVAVLSGGNIDPILLMNVLRHGMATTGRYLAFRVRIPDRPGGLARLLADLAQANANVLDVVHQRTGSYLHIGEVEVALQVETRGAPHAAEVLRHLRENGYPVSE
jgi:threonine dehydratase